MINKLNEKTFFASPERMNKEEVNKLSQEIIKDPVLQAVLEAVEGYAVILNENRQILACNDEILDALSLTPGDTLGLRPGELLECQHLQDAPSGCGTSENCRNCGAVLAILATQKSNIVSKGECYLNMLKDGKFGSIDFQVHATPIQVKGHKLIIFVLIDISKAKRKDLLERVFFHDINNILTTFLGYISLIKMSNNFEHSDSLLKTAETLKNEIRFQQTLIDAENGTLQVRKSPVSINDFIKDLALIFNDTAIKSNKKLEYEYLEPDIIINIDISILNKIMVNMIKNAFEAVSENEIVKIYINVNEDEISFNVYNEGYIEQTTALSIFHRSFTTKSGKGRGIGTYSMKLFGETYLKGKVEFNTSKEKGTVFRLRLKRDLLK